MKSYKRSKEESSEETLQAAAVSAERIPPQALDVERTVLGSMLIDGEAASIAFESIDETAFYSGANRKIFNCMKELFDKGSPIDIVTITDALRKRSWLEAVGEEPYIAELAEAIATSANIEYYAKILREKATLRELITRSAEITTECFAPDVSAQEILDRAEGKIFGIAESNITSKFEKISQLLPHTFKDIEAYEKGGYFGIPTGFKKLDELTTGMQKGDLIIVAGRPSMGKTSFAMSIAANAAIRSKIPTAVFSLEMSKQQLAQRLLCAEAKVDMHLLRSGKLPHSEHHKLSIGAGGLYEAPLYLDDTASISVLELRAKARRLKAQGNIQLILIDYLQLMQGAGSAESRQQEISQISRSLKGVAKELDLPIIVLSQLSRAPEARTDHRPMLSDLRESGAIEQDADVVMFVYRDAVYNKELPEDQQAIAEIIIGKQRNGPIDTVKVAFINKYAKFDNLDEYAMPMGEGAEGF